MNKKAFIFFLVLALPFAGKAQLGFIFSAEAGLAGSTVKSDEIPVFLTSYNTYNSTAGLSQGFGMKQGMAKGKYMHIMVGMGGEITKMTVGFGRYLVSTPHNEARFSNGEGRDVWTELKDATTEVGLRFDAGRFTVGTQFDMIIRTVSIYSQYVFQDGSRSLAGEHALNGVFSSFRLQVGVGGNIGFRVLPHLYLVAKCDYVFQTDKKHPEYHQYEDLNEFKGAQDYLPRDMAEYTAEPWNGSGNSISNDVRGLRFGFGIQVMLSTFDFDNE